MNKLKKYKDEKGLSYEDLAKKLGVSRDVVVRTCNIEGANVLYIRAKMLELIRRKLKINMVSDISTSDIQKEQLTYKNNK